MELSMYTIIKTENYYELKIWSNYHRFIYRYYKEKYIDCLLLVQQIGLELSSNDKLLAA